MKYSELKRSNKPWPWKKLYEQIKIRPGNLDDLAALFDGRTFEKIKKYFEEKEKNT